MNIAKVISILLVENEPMTVSTGEKSLEKCGYKIIKADSGEKALDLIRLNNDINLIFIDIGLKNGLNGPDTAGHFLKEKKIPILFLFNHTEPESIKKTENIPSYGYVEKNSEITVIDASIKSSLGLFETMQNERKKKKNCWIVRKNSAFLSRIVTILSILLQRMEFLLLCHLQ
jgi:DNA-binding response OmpR family regulator